MGYRSTMILGIPPEQKKEFEVILKKHYGEFMNEVYKTLQLVKENKDVLIYEGEYLKWYPEFADVKEITEFLENTYKKNETWCFSVGIGEDGKIHTELGEWYDFVGIYTTHEIY
mgnify:CR=1 FL=1|jgi:transcriptional regulator of heat shock response|tara:strand:- start:99 stop:440 length:342 start_codon:yes stop_codon:yes gene_type:complete